ncbi:MAG: haloacid dehalogenase superfamily enzyme subfamily [Betaproteobacteria bacterium]|nr:haloacid dehalogenase superfamily enzyme subfamily [Betaproteobacteria bacterium]
MNRPSSIKAVAFDLDDTLWPVAPIIDRAEKAMIAWVAGQYPHLAGQFDINNLRLLRASLVAQDPALKTDVLKLRRGTIRAAFEEGGEDEAAADRAFEYFREQRNRVEFYPDALPALERLRPHFRLAVISNGFADLAAIGIHGHFAAVVSAHEVGVSKPDPAIYAACLERLGLQPEETIYVGDDPHNDIVGPNTAGMHAAWINRHRRPWPEEHAEAGEPAQFRDLTELTDWLLAPH